MPPPAAKRLEQRGRVGETVGLGLHEADPSAQPIDIKGQGAQLLTAFTKIRSADVRAAILTLVKGLTVS